MTFELVEKPGEKQRLRFGRFLTSAAAYGMCALVLLVCFYFDIVRLSWAGVWAFIGAMVLANLAFLVMIRTDFNLRFRDPSLTIPQILVAVFFTLLGLYFLNVARTSLSIVLILSCLFGIYKLKTRDFFLVSVLAILGYVGVVLMLLARHPEVVDWRLEILQVLMLTIVMYWISLIGGYIGHLQENLRKANRQLTKALETNKFLANHDELTGVLNRRRLNQVLDHEKHLAERGNYSFYVCLLDLDHFKSVNDAYGHQQGDVVLACFAEMLGNRLRRTDHVARYGGEEFMVLLCNTDREGALACMEEIRLATKKLDLDQVEKGFSITVSIGVTKFAPCEDIEHTVARADEALYRAKNEGRDRVCFGPSQVD